LEKRSKKLLIPEGPGNDRATSHGKQSFFASFCSQKEVLDSLFSFSNGFSVMLRCGGAAENTGL
jgi:hypothetical protein